MGLVVTGGRGPTGGIGPDGAGTAVGTGLAGEVRCWQALADAVRNCTACALAAGRVQAVPGDLPTAADPQAVPLPTPVVLVGEGPGEQEDVQGRPFVGRSGRLLDALLAEAGLHRSEMAVLNVVKCRPPGNRTPTPQEAHTCRQHLDRQLALLTPGIIVALGSSAARQFIAGLTSLAGARGRLHPWRGSHVIVTYHPSAALRSGPRGVAAIGLRQDLAQVRRMLEAGLRPHDPVAP